MVGKLSFEGEKLVENIQSFVDFINNMKPAAVRGQYMRGVAISATMAPGIRVAI
jgi:large subunit ribosomal protein L1